LSRTPESDPPTARLVAVTIDWLPAWVLPAYGATWVASPALDAVAAAGVVFDRALAQSVCLTETRSLLLPFDGAPELEGQVARAGDLHEAAEFVANGRHRVVLCHLDRLGRSWEAPAELRERYRDAEDPPAMEGTTPPSFAIDEKTDPDRLTVVRQAFAAEMTAIDERLGLLLEAVAGCPSPWHICVAGTGGMPLGLHGQVGVAVEESCIRPHGERVQLPVILREAGGRMAGQRFPGIVSAADIGATLAAWLGIAAESWPPESASLAGLFESWTAPGRERLFIRGRAAAAMATPEWHLVAAWPRGKDAGVEASLFAKPDDWFEVTDVADRCPAETEAMLQECLANPDLPA
jgi:hypothetical protein